MEVRPDDVNEFSPMLLKLAGRVIEVIAALMKASSPIVSIDSSITTAPMQPELSVTVPDSATSKDGCTYVTAYVPPPPQANWVGAKAANKSVLIASLVPK